MSDVVLERLMELTQYANIAKVNGTYVITFDTHNRSLVKGLQPTNDGFRLTHEEFNDIPLAFFSTLHDDERNLWSVHEYWTLGGKLHRDNDLPAYICLSVSGGFIRVWYQHGVCTRANGPAHETGVVEEDHATEIEGGFTKHVYKSFVRTWIKPDPTVFGYMDSTKGRDPLAGPYEIYMKNAVIYTDPRGQIISPGDECAITCEELIVGWEEATGRLYPTKLWALGFSEHRPNGVLTGRVAGNVEAYWNKAYTRYNHNDCARWLYLNMFQDLNLFDGEFFANQTDEFFALSEFDKIVGKLNVN